MSRRRVLIIEDGTAGYVLPAARSLARAGWTVGLGSASPNPRTRGSRVVDRRHVVSRPEAGLDEFIDSVNAAIEREGYDLLIPADDIEMLALSVARDRLRAIVPYADHEIVLRSADKLELAAAAERAGLASPRTELATAASIATCELPVMVKSRLHWTPGTGSSIRHLLVRRLDDRVAVQRRVAEIEAAGGSAVLQEPLTGRQIAVSIVVDASQRIVAASSQTTLMFSLEGPSTRAITIEPSAELLDQIATLVHGLGWSGLANLQFFEPVGARPHLIDWNGRLYGSLALAVAAGVDLPAIWAACATGGGVPDQVRPRSGVRFQELEQDLVRAREQRRGGLVIDLARTLAFAPRAAHTVWSARDPVPAIRWGAILLGRALRPARSARRRRTALRDDEG